MTGIGLVVLEPALEAYAILFTAERRRLHARVHWRISKELEVSAHMLLAGHKVILEPTLEAVAGDWGPYQRFAAAALHRRYARQFFVSADVIESRTSALASGPRFLPRRGGLYPRQPRRRGARPWAKSRARL